jgi:hypothetical protein
MVPSSLAIALIMYLGIRIFSVRFFKIQSGVATHSNPSALVAGAKDGTVERSFCGISDRLGINSPSLTDAESLFAFRSSVSDELGIKEASFVGAASFLRLVEVEKDEYVTRERHARH